MHVLFLLSTLVKIFSRPVNSLLSRFTLKRSVLDYDVFSTNNGIPRKNFGKQNKFMRIKINNRKRDSEDYQSFVSQHFYFGFRFRTKFLAVFGDFLRGFSVSNRPVRPPLSSIHSMEAGIVGMPTLCNLRDNELAQIRSGTFEENGSTALLLQQKYILNCPYVLKKLLIYTLFSPLPQTTRSSPSFPKSVVAQPPSPDPPVTSHWLAFSSVHFSLESPCICCYFTIILLTYKIGANGLYNVHTLHVAQICEQILHGESWLACYDVTQNFFSRAVSRWGLKALVHVTGETTNICQIFVIFYLGIIRSIEHACDVSHQIQILEQIENCPLPCS